MTKEQLAEKLNGREYPFDVSDEEATQAEKSGLVIVFGSSDDLFEVRGAITEEFGCYDGGTFRIADGEFVPGEIDRDDEEVLEKYGVLKQVESRLKSAAKIHAQWSVEPGYSWTYKTEIPHATFEITEGGSPYCRGIVFDLKDVPA